MASVFFNPVNVSGMHRSRKITFGLDISKSVGLEIGPLTSPVVTKEEGKIFYLDHTTTNNLKKKYIDDASVSKDDIVEVDFVLNKFSIVESVRNYSFDYVIASHVIEHVPNLVQWLQELQQILIPEGVIRLAIPDKRFTFDILRPLTDITDILAAHIEKRRNPSAKQILEFHLLWRMVNQQEIWNGSLDLNSVRENSRPDIKEGIRFATESTNGVYHDVHAWVFTQNTFAIIMQQLCELDLIDLGLEWFIPVERNQQEFFVSLRRFASARMARDSYGPMADYKS